MLVLFVTILKVILASSPFDLSALKDYNKNKNYPTIRKSGSAPFRPFGVKRPSESEVVSDKLVTKHQKTDNNMYTNPPKNENNVPTISDILTKISFPAVKTDAKVEIPKPKPGRKRICAIDTKMTSTEIIENELNFGTKINDELKKDVLRWTLRLIADNNHTELAEHQETFKETFGRKFGTFMRNGIPNYLNLFVILFGSHDLSTLIESKHHLDEKTLEILPDILRYLFNTKSFKVSISTVLNLCSDSISADLKEELITIINRRFPDLDYFERFAINMIGATFGSSMVKIFDAASDIEKVKILTNINFASNPEYLIYFQRLPLDRPDLYNSVDLKNSERFYFLETIFQNDNVEILPKVLDIHPDIVLYNLQFDTLPLRFHTENVFLNSIRRDAHKCFEFFLDLMPEFLENDSIITKTAISMSNISTQFLEILEKYGVTFETMINPESRREPMSVFQYAFNSRNPASSKYYYDKAGEEKAKHEIRKLWETDNLIVENLFRNFKDYDCEFIKRITNDLAINLNERKFEYYGKKGNASVFVEFWNSQNVCAQLNIEIERNNLLQRFF